MRAGEDGLREQVVERESVFPGKVIDVQVWKVTLPNGKTATREVALHRGAAAVVAVDGQGRVAMVRQYRAALERILLEIPAGKLDSASEDPLLCARRELREETGLTASSMVPLTAMCTTPGFSSEIIHIYLATGLTQSESQPDEDEFLSFTWESFPHMVNLARAGGIPDGKTALGLLLAEAALGGKHG